MSNIILIDYLTKCRIDMYHFTCISFSTILIAIGITGFILLILSIILSLNNIRRVEDD